MGVNWFVLIATALAAGVEFVEAFTIVLAVGVTRGWRSALGGAIVALLLLAVLVAVFGVTVLRIVPLGALKTAVGIFLLLFGLKWLRNALLRYSGLKALRDEAAAFQSEVATLKASAGGVRAIDWAAATTSFNGVFLEMLEATLIVLALGSGAKAMGSAITGAVAAAALVAVTGYTLRSPLERVPENTMKFVVGIMLTTFGTFWAGEGTGVAWWHSDLALAPLLAGYLLMSWVFVMILRRSAAGGASSPASAQQIGA